MSTADPFQLDRFVEAQNSADSYGRALAELCAGHKRGHWIWFIFPQIEGLGSSEMSRRYAIASLNEAAAYLEHPVLGPRLIAAAEALLGLETRDAEAVLGGIDALKLRSSMTLFALVPGAPPGFRRVIDEFYGGLGDEATERRL